MATVCQDAAETEAVPPTAVGGSRVRAGGNKTRQIDDFLNEIKNRQEGKVDPALAAANGGGVGGGFDGASSGAAGLDLPGGRGAGAAGASWGAGAAFGMSKGSFDNGDPYTTNLYIGNLAPTTTGNHTFSMSLLMLCRYCALSTTATCACATAQTRAGPKL